MFRGEYKDAHGIPQFDVELLEHLEQILCISQSEVIDLAVELRDDYGINDLQDFKTCMLITLKSITGKLSLLSIGQLTYLNADFPTFIVIDWQATWNYSIALRLLHY